MGRSQQRDDADENTVGTLIIAIYETDKKELVWEASGSSRVIQLGSPEQSEEGINNSIK